ncbi:hypothetical protein ACQPYK_18750 [Streptosporangium sp. CA-135522]|uniref:hypothetical protein n=1 Tax=Streptosporangium sp. CA-135522 TaxID=3240072 RepID=UPI003D94267E
MRKISHVKIHRKWAALALLAATQFVLILDLTIISVASPSMGLDLGLSQQELSWMTTAYALALGLLRQRAARRRDPHHDGRAS